jgi:hypothetical protein
MPSARSQDRGPLTFALYAGSAFSDDVDFQQSPTNDELSLDAEWSL